MLTRWLAAGVLLGIPTGLLAADKKDCSPQEARMAEEGVDRLRSWADLHQAFTQFAHCDDGAVAEGYSDTVVEMLANRWPTLLQLNALVSTNPEFGDFVIRHIDVSARWSSSEVAAQNAQTSCPKAAAALCSRIVKRVDELRRVGEKKR
jgi:hypothetical protein